VRPPFQQRPTTRARSSRQTRAKPSCSPPRPERAHRAARQLLFADTRPRADMFAGYMSLLSPSMGLGGTKRCAPTPTAPASTFNAVYRMRTSMYVRKTVCQLRLSAPRLPSEPRRLLLGDVRPCPMLAVESPLTVNEPPGKSHISVSPPSIHHRPTRRGRKNGLSLLRRVPHHTACSATPVPAPPDTSANQLRALRVAFGVGRGFPQRPYLLARDASAHERAADPNKK